MDRSLVCRSLAPRVFAVLPIDSTRRLVDIV